MDIQERANSYFKENPARNEIYFTSDGQAFWAASFARAHAQGLKDRQLVKETRKAVASAEALKQSIEDHKGKLKQAGTTEEVAGVMLSILGHAKDPQESAETPAPAPEAEKPQEPAQPAKARASKPRAKRQPKPRK